MGITGWRPFFIPWGQFRAIHDGTWLITPYYMRLWGKNLFLFPYVPAIPSFSHSAIASLYYLRPLTIITPGENVRCAVYPGYSYPFRGVTTHLDQRCSHANRHYEIRCAPEHADTVGVSYTGALFGACSCGLVRSQPCTNTDDCSFFHRFT